jgi:hypothetical protein
MRTGAAAAIAVAALVLAAPPALATANAQPTATGTYTTQVLSQDVFRESNGVGFVKEVDMDTYTGGLVGAVTDTYTFNFVLSNESGAGHGTEVCNSCTIGGRTGGYTAVFHFRVPAGGGNFTGALTFISGTGGLTGLRGGGNFQGNGTVNTYSYTYHFEP